MLIFVFIMFIPVRSAPGITGQAESPWVVDVRSGDGPDVPAEAVTIGAAPLERATPALPVRFEADIDEEGKAKTPTTGGDGLSSPVVAGATATVFASSANTAASPTTTTIQTGSAVGLSLSAPSPGGRYWEWGWGLYNDDVPAEVQALFDWSTISFGNVPQNQATLDRLNRILQINPDHKFVIEVWPILGLGDRMDENRFQGTLFHYLYKPGVREAVLQEVRDQIGFVLDGITKPGNVVGLTFLEELPLSFTTGRKTLGWQRGQDMPWDLSRFEAQINAELGEPFDMGLEAHRLWWGEKYSEVLAEIHAVMKQAGGGREIFIWQATAFRTLDMLQPGESMIQDDVVPIHYRDIVKPGLVDGIFGYPNTPAIWREKTTSVAEGLGVPFWSQLSTPGYMRASQWEETLRLVREERPGNLGTLIYCEPSTGAGVWNPMPYEDGVTRWAAADHARMLSTLLPVP